MIAGLPGSGKTELGKKIAKDTGKTIVDDPESLEDVLLTDGNIVLTDPFLCETDTRERISLLMKQRFPDIEQETIFFENDPVQANANANRRENRNVKGLITYLTKVYEPDGDTIPVYKPEN